MKLEAFLNPKSVAVIGASREEKKVGHRILRNLINSGFKGSIYPINPNADTILGYKCYKSVNEVEEDVDLAIIAVPAKTVLEVVEECGRKGVKGIVVISAGFSEIGREGLMLEKQLVSKCREYGMRLQGPNCLGLINSKTGLNASFAPTSPIPGNISIVSQSGALGSAILNWAGLNGMGLANFVSVGNEADLSIADFLEAFAEDENTTVIGIYIEGVKNGEHFIEAASKVTRSKPLVALKSGTTEVGIRAVSSHTGSLAGSDAAFTAACKKTGIVRVETIKEFFDLLFAFQDQPLPKGKNVLVITNGGGPGVLAVDACEKLGLNLPLLEQNLRELLRNQFPPHASLGNPLDVLGDADEKRYKIALEAALKSNVIDSIIIILTPQAMTPSEEIAREIAEISKTSKKPILASFMGFDNDSTPIRILRKYRISNYDFPESAAIVLKRMYDYYLASSKYEEPIAKITGVDNETVVRIKNKVKAEGRVNLSQEEAFQIASAYGIPVPKSMLARSAKEACEIAESIGYPVVIKVSSPDILHKTDMGCVILNVKSCEEVSRAYELVVNRARMLMPQVRVSGVIVQKMAPWGREVIIGAVRDPQFGPLIMFGLGGIYVNFLRDVSYRLAPLTPSDAMEMISETKAYTLLKGVRGELPADFRSLIDVMIRISQFMCCFKDVVEMEINPLIVYEEGKGCMAVDIKITLNKDITEEKE
ncbi:MAG: acetate--CoA ligase family protein [Crenarchaeota archaeon]|nr:acetate--CoA ligase family protein [Thermoproteota archaeon]MDW8033535.1 acetate--CoA ligase family protein [Nitrososphaerota archaeon]